MVVLEEILETLHDLGQKNMVEIFCWGEYWDLSTNSSPEKMGMIANKNEETRKIMISRNMDSTNLEKEFNSQKGDDGDVT